MPNDIQIPDVSDFNQQRWGRTHRNGVNTKNEFGQITPYFFTRDGAQAGIEGIYRGSSVFLICNGPSLNEYDLTQLYRPGVIKFGVNNGPAVVRPNLWTCVDDPVRFLKSIWKDPTITKFIPYHHMEKEIIDPQTFVKSSDLVGDCPNVLAFKRNEKFQEAQFLTENTINWGNHKDYGGGRSVMLASLKILYVLGFRKVFILGADFKMSVDYTYAFDERRERGAVVNNMTTYDKLSNHYFPKLQPYFEQAGFHVYNCNEKSNLKIFPYVPYNEAIEQCAAPLGDVSTERTWGMYVNPKKRDGVIVEPSEEEKKRLLEEDKISLNEKISRKLVKNISAVDTPESIPVVSLSKYRKDIPSTPPTPPPLTINKTISELGVKDFAIDKKNSKLKDILKDAYLPEHITLNNK